MTFPGFLSHWHSFSHQCQTVKCKISQILECELSQLSKCEYRYFTRILSEHSLTIHLLQILLNIFLNRSCKFLIDFLFLEPTADTWNLNSLWRSLPPNSESWQNATHFNRKWLRVYFFFGGGARVKVSWALKISHTL